MKEEIIFSYTTKQAGADGSLIQIKKENLKLAGIKVPVYITSALYWHYIHIPKEKDTGFFPNLDSKEVYFLKKFAQKAKETSGSEMNFGILLFVPRDYEKLPNEICFLSGYRTVTFKSVITAQDIDDPSPAFFIMLPSED